MYSWKQALATPHLAQVMPGQTVEDVLNGLLGAPSVNCSEVAGWTWQEYLNGNVVQPIADGVAQWMLNQPDKHAKLHGGKLLRKLADRGSGASMFNLAVEKAKGVNIELDEPGANSLCKKIVTTGNGDDRLLGMANAFLGDSARLGRGWSRNLRAALTCYENAAELGNPEAAFNAALFYEGKVLGWVEDQDLQSAADLYEIAAAAGHVAAQTNLGILHVLGALDTSDAARGRQLLRRSLSAGDMVAGDMLDQLADGRFDPVARLKSSVEGVHPTPQTMDPVAEVAGSNDGGVEWAKGEISRTLQTSMAAAMNAMGGTPLTAWSSAGEMTASMMKSLDEWAASSGVVDPALEGGLAMPSTIASWLLANASAALESAEVRIAVLGSSAMERHAFFGLIGPMVGKPDLRVCVDFVGPDAMTPFSSWGLARSTAHKITTGQYARKGDASALTLAIAFHPGFEEHGDEWLRNDDGLKQLVDSKVPVIGCSYAPEEYASDAAIAEAWGLEVANFANNPFKSGTGAKTVPCDAWLCACTWSLQRGAKLVDSEREARLKAIGSAVNMAACFGKIDLAAGKNRRDSAFIADVVRLNDGSSLAEYVVLIRGFAVRKDSGEVVRRLGARTGGTLACRVPGSRMARLPGEGAKWIDKALWVDQVWRRYVLPQMEAGDGLSCAHAMVGGAVDVSQAEAAAVFGMPSWSSDLAGVMQALSRR